MSNERITLKAFQAPEEPALCAEFLHEHRMVLEEFGISHVTTNNEVWMHDPYTYVIVALHETMGMVGGIRLKIDDGITPIPMADAIRKLDPRVDKALAELQPYSNGEVCGLWNAHRFNGKNIPVLLSQAVTAMAVPAGARKMVCFVAHYTQKHPARNGFVVMDNLGDQGFFPGYPIPRIIAIAMVNPDTMLLEHATAQHRQFIYSLRLRPEQERVETHGSTTFEVTYRMRLSNALHDLYAYQQIEADRLRQAI
ncbi:MAG TPA: hypothetical protein PLY76_09265 [Flavobacteriales bacterium]|nr:hypothetical protein [Flavobacteriales bacterium]